MVGFPGGFAVDGLVAQLVRRFAASCARTSSCHSPRGSLLAEMPVWLRSFDRVGQVGHAALTVSAFDCSVKSPRGLSDFLSWGSSQRSPLHRYPWCAFTPGSPPSPLRGCPAGWTNVRTGSRRPSRRGFVTNRRPRNANPGLVPPLPFLTTSTVYSAHRVQVCFTLLPIMGFAWLQTRRGVGRDGLTRRTEVRRRDTDRIEHRSVLHHWRKREGEHPSPKRRVGAVANHRPRSRPEGRLPDSGVWVALCRSRANPCRGGLPLPSLSRAILTGADTLRSFPLDHSRIASPRPASLSTLSVSALFRPPGPTVLRAFLRVRVRCARVR